MDGRRFDDLTRALGRTTSRRQVLKGIVVGFAAAATGFIVPAPRRAAAARACDQQASSACLKDVRTGYHTCVKACRKLACGPKSSLGDPELCLSCQTTCLVDFELLKRECETRAGCASGETCCPAGCVDTDTDPSNCGACGVICPGDQTCQGGSCDCPAGQTTCAGVCVDTHDDGDNCGACGVTCGPCETCRGSYCLPTDCGPGALCCNGACMAECAVDQELTDDCQCVCPDATRLCGGDCVDAFCANPNQAFDPATCQCACPAISCADGMTLDLDTCTCVVTCDCPPDVLGRPTACVDGHCVCPVIPGTDPPISYTDCDGACVNIRGGYDRNNCGDCGIVCPNNLVCVTTFDVVCGCAGGTQLCGDICADTWTDPNNCGGCGCVCPEGTECPDGNGCCHMVDGQCIDFFYADCP